MQTLLYSINIALSIVFPLFVGASFVGANLNKVSVRLLSCAATIGISCYFYHAWFEHVYVIISMLLIAILFLKYSIKLSYRSAVVSFLFASALLFIIRIIQNMVGIALYIQADNIYQSVIVIAGYIISGTAIYYKPFRILPKNLESNWFFDKNKKQDNDFVYLKIVFLLGFLFAGALYVLMNLHYLKQAALISIFTVLAFFLCTGIIRTIVFLENERQAAMLESFQYKEMHEFMNIIRSQRHDFNFHLHSIEGMLKSEKYSECLVYLDEMINEARGINEVLPLYHPAVGALINNFREIAANKKITITVQIYYDLRYISCSVNEINKIIGNLLQNAIDEMEKSLEDSRNIQLTILKRARNAVIKVSNKVNPREIDMHKIFKIGYSTKAFHEGTGLNTVNRIVAKYDGAVFPELKDDVISFLVHIPIKL